MLTNAPHPWELPDFLPVPSAPLETTELSPSPMEGEEAPRYPGNYAKDTCTGRRLPHLQWWV